MSFTGKQGENGTNSLRPVSAIAGGDSNGASNDGNAAKLHAGKGKMLISS